MTKLISFYRLMPTALPSSLDLIRETRQVQKSLVLLVQLDQGGFQVLVDLGKLVFKDRQLLVRLHDLLLVVLEAGFHGLHQLGVGSGDIRRQLVQLASQLSLPFVKFSLEVVQLFGNLSLEQI